MLLIVDGGRRFHIKECQKYYLVTTCTRYTVRTSYKFYKDVFYSIDEVRAFIYNVLIKQKQY